jgi:hypothetical protein
MKCKKHPQYKAIFEPRCDCLDCWKIYARSLKEYNDAVDKFMEVCELEDDFNNGEWDQDENE